MNDPLAPFDPFVHPTRQGPCGGSAAERARSALRGLSIAALWIALPSALALLALRARHLLGGPLPVAGWTLKSAVPLIAVGLSYLALIFSLPRTPRQRVLGCCVGLAFVLWGTEQYLDDPGLIALLDDIVVFLFVLDLGLVIYKNLADAGKRGENTP